jgi:hypothetical protein
VNADEKLTAGELKKWEDAEYPYFVEINGREYRADFQLPKGYEECVYHVNDKKYLDICVRCTDARRPGSTRDVCLGMQFINHRPICLTLRLEHFVTE